MEERQIKINTYKHKNFATVQVHGLCRCGIYISGQTIEPILILDNGGVEPLHTHFTLVCPKCGRILNLIDVSKTPLKNKREA
jgi:hypothetical protein